MNDPNLPGIDRLEDRHVIALGRLDAPGDVKRRFPTSDAIARLVMDARRAVSDVVHGKDGDRLVVVVGPCSIHDPEAAFDYARRLHSFTAGVSDELVVVMRTYFEKPRTTVGWKGLVYDPHLDGSYDIASGLDLARQILVEVNGLGLPCAVELLDPITPQYLADLVTWAAIGARTVESQIHRQLASGLSMPVGLKNGTDGRIAAAAHAMTAAGRPHSFFGVDEKGRAAVVRTSGNPDRHLVLRGGRDRGNYDPESVAEAADLVAGQGIVRPIMVDCSHGNSGKDYTRQQAVWDEALSQYAAGQQAIMGLMLESHLRPGRQDWRPDAQLEYGVSITDACIGWDETADLLSAAAAAVRLRRDR
jgi:3-deoxy-7-phosphoheptulonate synthase